ncbi:tyrosine-type recombinase/integrase [Herbiconiux daphne]|uniref:tyrosine-type recombinase/integrase n=1 Tax=Herbiconiux daphne TaxID=2970914 RepID=UPI00217D01E4|nr:site-specific integrase [Herbiconiux daphne]
MTVAEWLREWLSFTAMETTRPKTIRGYMTVVKNQINPYIGHIPLKELRPRDVRMMAAGICSSGLSSTTANQAHRVLSAALVAAERDELVNRNVAKLIPAPRKAVSPQKALTLEECHRVFAAAKGDPLESLWMAALLTGAREGELLGLERDRVSDFLEISWQLQRLIWSHGCGGRCGASRGSDCPARVVPAPPDWESRHVTGGLWLTRPKSRASWRLVPVVEPLRSKLESHMRSEQGPNPHNLVWHQDNGRPIDPKNHIKMWHALLERAQVPQVRFHDARHTAVDLLYSADVPEDVIREIVGHSSWEMTRVYKSRANRARLTSAMNQLGDWVST